MIHTVEVSVLDPKACLPSGNPFPINAISSEPLSPQLPIEMVQTGIKLILPDRMKLDIVPLQDDITITGWNMGDGLRVIVVKNDPNVVLKEPFANVFVVVREIDSVRFVQFSDGRE